jgi:hypothetical protein
MIKNKNIDDLFREGAAGFEIEPSSEAWKKIEAAHLVGKEKNIFQYWWLFSALLLGLFLYFVLPDFNKKEEAANFVNQIDSIKFENGEVNTFRIAENKDSLKADYKQDTEIKKETPKRKIQSEEQQNQPGQASQVNFGLNVVGTFTGFDIKTEKYDNLRGLNNLTVNELNSETDNYLHQHEIPGLEKYVEKKSNFHFYSGLGGTAGMMYYPATKDKFTYSADLSFGLKIKKVYLETGIGYQEMSEEGTVNIQFITQDSIGYYNKVLSFEVDPLNPANIIYNTLKTTVYDSINHFTVTYPTYQYNYLNFPLVVGYRIFDENKLIFSAQAGIIFSTMIGESFQPVDISSSDYQIVETINTTPLRVKNNLQMQLALRFGYRITSGLSVIAQPVFSKYLNSIYDAHAGYQNVKPYSMGVRVGIYYYF